MIVLDTDHMSLLEWEDAGAELIRERLANAGSEVVATTIVSYEEQVRGWMAYIARAKTVAQQVQAYSRLRRQLENYRQIPILDFDDIAAAEYQRLRRLRVQIGTMDLKIAAIVLSQGALLLSRNLVDFQKLPGLKVEDWSC